MRQTDIVFAPEQIGNAPSVADEIRKRLRGRDFTITKRFIDARHKDNIKVIYRITTDRISDDNESTALPYMGRRFKCGSRPIIIGFGPAGMYAGLVLARYGLNPIIIEKGRDVQTRTEDVGRYKKDGIINPSSNIQFGEGGAGTFSDGKLYTGVTSGLKGFIGETMVRHGAPKDILYDSHPHVGTDNLVNVVKGIREEIISFGGEVHFGEELLSISVSENTMGSDIKAIITDKGEYKTDKLILAIGNSSREFFKNNRELLQIESKPFSIGVRIEHLRYDIDMAMYGFDTSVYRNIFAANYKLAADTSTGRKLYTFCMCPGGEVVPSASFDRAICTNGMSYRARDGVNSNSALLIPFNPAEYSSDPLYGMEYQTMLENASYRIAGETGFAPYMTYGDLRAGKSGTNASRILPTYSPGAVPSDFNELFPKEYITTLIEGISVMGRKINGFDSDDSILTAVETRSSSPVRIPRNKDTFESVAVRGIYPAGEGAGYAGGIMSSAIDGIKCANSIAAELMVE